MISYYDKYGEKLKYIDFIELQWNRKYHEAGNFVLYMPASLYDEKIKYIKNSGRPETGIVQKVVYEKESYGDFVTLSGSFIEKLLDFNMTSSSFSNNIAGSGATEERKYTERFLKFLLCNYFSQFDQVLYNDLSSEHYDGDVWSKPNLYCTHVEKGEYPRNRTFDLKPFTYIGQWIYGMLQKDGYSYTCYPVFNPNGKSKEGTEPLIGISLKCWSGRDLSDKVFFGHAWGNVEKIDYTFDDSAAVPMYVGIQEIPEEIKNYSGVSYIYWENGTKKVIKENYFYDINSKINIGKSYPCKAIDTAVSDIKANNESTVRSSMKEAMKLDMLNNYIAETISCKALQNRFFYLKDYDLGDKCTVVIDEIEKQYKARIVAINEVHRDNVVDIEVVLGTPKKQKYRKVLV